MVTAKGENHKNNENRSHIDELKIAESNSAEVCIECQCDTLTALPRRPCVQPHTLKPAAAVCSPRALAPSRGVRRATHRGQG